MVGRIVAVAQLIFLETLRRSICIHLLRNGGVLRHIGVFRFQAMSYTQAFLTPFVSMQDYVQLFSLSCRPHTFKKKGASSTQEGSVFIIYVLLLLFPLAVTSAQEAVQRSNLMEADPKKCPRCWVSNCVPWLGPAPDTKKTFSDRVYVDRL